MAIADSMEQVTNLFTRYQPICSPLYAGYDWELIVDLGQTVEILQKAAEDGHRHWIVAFSGGKDSTLLTIVVCELIRRQMIPSVEVDVVYSDTLLELPPFAINALTLLRHVGLIAQREQLPVRVHQTVADIRDRFWFLMLGKGYPAPHNRFRWCTERLKINPSVAAIREFKEDHSIILTGVRYGESDARTGRLRAATCTKDGGECGQGLWLNGSRKIGIPGLAPIAHWRTCKVWDFLTFIAPTWGWSTDALCKLYNGSDTVRFGCWTCTLIGEDKALAAITRYPEWESFAILGQFRNKLQGDARQRENRLLRSNGFPGRLKLEYRRQLLKELLDLQKKVGVMLITCEEVKAIQDYWIVEQVEGDPYAPACKFWSPQQSETS